MCLKLHHCQVGAQAVQTIRFDARSAVPAPDLLTCNERQFEQMRDIYQRTGGLSSGDALAYRLRSRCDQPISMLAHWVVNRSLVAFEWRAALRIPLFQFSEDITVLRPAVTAVMKELGDVLSDWEIAAWFAAPNAWLLDRAPCELVGFDPVEVIAAARAARFVTLG